MKRNLAREASTDATKKGFQRRECLGILTSQCLRQELRDEKRREGTWYAASQGREWV